MKEPKKSVSVSLPLSLYERIRHDAELESRSVSGKIRLILKQYMMK